MSNHLAIATVTAAFSRMLASAAQIGVQNAAIRLGPPDAKTGTDGKPVVNLFLYQVTPNAERRNAHMPGRGSDGALANRSRVALDLRYVLSFYGDPQKLEPERMAGAVAAAVEDRPLLSRDAIRKAVAESNSVLQGSDLEDALSTVRITLEIHTLEELSRMWSIFFQVPYALSVSYLCSHVSIEVGEEVQWALPVATPRIYAAPISDLRIEEIVASDGPTRPIVWGATLVIRGRGLGATGLKLRIGATEITPASTERAGGEIRLKLETARFGDELPAGYHAVQAVVPPPTGAPGHLARASDAKFFALRPVLTVTDAGVGTGGPGGTVQGKMKVDFVPAVAEGQEVALMLDERAAVSPAAAALAPDLPGAFPAAALEFTYAGLKASKYLVRAQVDGVSSAPQIDTTAGSATFGEIIGPEVDLT